MPFKLRLTMDKPDILATIENEGFRIVRHGSRHWIRCPFHSDTKPSLVIDKEKQVWFCHGCQTGGDVITFIQKLHNLSFLEAIDYLDIEGKSSRQASCRNRCKSKAHTKTPEEKLQDEFRRLLQMRAEVEFRAAFQQWLNDRLAFLDEIVDKLEKALEVLDETSTAFDLLYLDFQKWQTEREILTNGSLAEKLAIADRCPRWRLISLHLRSKKNGESLPPKC